MAAKHLGSVAIGDGDPAGLPWRQPRKPGETDAEFNERVAARLTELMKASFSPVEMYGTQPSPLPAELPAGTAYLTNLIGDGGERVYASSSVILRNSNQYWGCWSRPNEETYIRAEHIDWANTPVVGQKPTPDPTTFEEQAALARQAFAEAEATAGVAPLVGPVRESRRVTSFGEVTITLSNGPISIDRINFSYVDDPE